MVEYLILKHIQRRFFTKTRDFSLTQSLAVFKFVSFFVVFLPTLVRLHSQMVLGSLQINSVISFLIPRTRRWFKRNE